MARTIPYSTPRRRQKHYRNQSRAILRQLGAASYLNGSQFAILWVNASGQTEVFSSDLLQRKLPEWFPRAVLGEARDLVLAGQAAREAHVLELCQGTRPTTVVTDVYGPTGCAILLPNPPTGDAFDDSDTDNDDPPSRGEAVSHSHLRSHLNLGSDEGSSHPPATAVRPPPYANGVTMPASPPSSSSAPARVTRSLSMLSVTNSNATSPAESSYPSPLLHSATNPRSSPTHSSRTFTPQTLAAWYTDKFSALRVQTCTQICKAWIHVVEPHKQASFPYLAGEASESSKPPWWPPAVRHLEPDHLVKPERITLLATLLRASGIPASRLEVATEVDAAAIGQTGLSILREVYKVAKEEQRALRASNNAPFEKLTAMLPNLARLDDDGDQSKPTRHRSRRSITSLSAEDANPRARAAHAPYPLSRSNSVSDVLSNSTPSRGMSRSHSMTTSLSASSGRLRRPKTETDDDSSVGPFDSPYSSSPGIQSPQMLQPAISLSSQDGRPVPRRSLPGTQSSPHVGSDQSSHRSPTEAFARPQEPSFASPAMIKSRSRLSHGPMPMVPISEAPHHDPHAYRYLQQGALPPHPQHEPLHIQVHAGHNLDPYQYPTTAYPTPTTFAYPSHVQDLPAHPRHPPHPAHPQVHQSYPHHPNHPPPQPPAFRPMSEDDHLRNQASHLRELEYHQAQEAQAQQLQQFLHEQAYTDDAQRLNAQHQLLSRHPSDQGSQGTEPLLHEPPPMNYYYASQPLDGGAAGPPDAQTIAYIQQLSEYEIERQQHELAARSLGMDQSGMYDDSSLEISELERREANQRRYHEHVYGSQ